MKRFAAATTLFVAIAAVSLRAQTQELRASIPFDFQVRNVMMPAGDYKIFQSGEVLKVRSEDGRIAGAITLTLPTTRSGETRMGTLEFTRYDDMYFLTRVWAPGSTEGRQLPKSAQEKDLARNGALVQTAGVALRDK